MAGESSLGQGRMLLDGLGCQVGDGRVAENSSVGRGG